MCGIGGLYNTDYDEWEHNELFIMISDRGRHAAGIAWLPIKKNGILVTKAARPSAYLVARGIGKYVGTKNKWVMQHARFTTQGSTKNNYNNHPIEYDNIILTHNGVLENDGEVLVDLGVTRRYEVDTEAIAAALAIKDWRYVLKNIEGSISIAWVDRNKPDEINLMTNGRNPLVIAEMFDGGFAWASLPYMMDHLEYIHIFDAEPYCKYTLKPSGMEKTKY